jgi:putrescine importer
MTESSASTQPGAPRLKRVLTLGDLIFYGIVRVQPIAPVPLFGVAQKLSDGHFATIILIAMFAMMITAVSYGRMVRTGKSSGRGKRLEFWTRVVV